MHEPKKGLLTFRAEGDDIKSGRNYSRYIHWPGVIRGCSKNNSDVTIGRGFDLGDISQANALLTLRRAGIPDEQGRKIAEGASLKGCLAYEFVKKNRDNIGKITGRQQVSS